MARGADGLPPKLGAGRAAVSRPPRALPSASTNDIYFPQQDGSDGAADTNLGRIYAAERSRWRGRTLERRNVALSAERFCVEDASHGTVWRLVPAGGYDDPGLGRDLRGARDSL